MGYLFGRRSSAGGCLQQFRMVQGGGRKRANLVSRFATWEFSLTAGPESGGVAGCGGRQSRSGRKAEGLRLPPHPLANASSTHCRALWGGQTGSGWFDGALVHRVVGSGLSSVASVVVRRPETRGMARRLRLWRPTQPANPPDSGPAVGESPGRKPTPKVRPLATSSYGPCGIGEDTLQ